MTRAQPVELLERVAETEAIDAALTAAADGSGGVLVVEGVGGLGKSSLLTLASAQAAERGFRVLDAVGDDLEEGLPWGVAIQLFAEVARDRDADALFSRAAGLARPLLERVAPPPGAGGQADAFPLLHGLHWLTVGLGARQPLLLVVDDAHWADPESLRFLAYLQARIGELRALVLAAVRPGEGQATAGELLARLRAGPGSTSFVLAPLSGASLGRLVRRELPAAEEPFCEAIAAAAGGNPFLARELAIAARDDLLTGTAESVGRLGRLHPESIRHAILVRLGRLGDDAGRVAAAVAVLGPAGDPRAVAVLADLDDERTARAADALVAAGILVASERLAFMHPIVRELVYTDLPPLRRRRAHAHAAALLHELDCAAEVVAPHLEAGERVDEEWAVATLREAATAALGKGAPRRAARHLRRAIDTLGDGADAELLLAAGLAELSGGEHAAVEHLRAAADRAVDPKLNARALSGLARALYVEGATAAAVSTARTALHAVPAGRGGRIEAELLLDLAFAARAVPAEVRRVREILRRSRLDDAGEVTAAEVVRRLGLALDETLRGRTETCRRHVDVALPAFDDPRLAGELPARALIAAAFSLCRLGDEDRAQALLDPELERARRRGGRVDVAQLLEVRSLAQHRRGDVNGALADIDALLGLQEDAWEVATIPVRVARASLLLERGEPETAAAMLDLPDDLERRLPGTWAAIRLPWGRAVLAAAARDWHTCLEQALLAGERALAVDAPSPDYVDWRSLAARAAARLGDRGRAEGLAAEELELARAAASARATGVALAALGEIAGGDDGVELLEAAIVELDRASSVLEGARARLRLGVALRHARRPRDARAPLREALDGARRAGSIVLAERALAELRSTGARPRRAALSGLESLTPTERRVAGLVADGLSNQEAAETLFVTLRTVETHLTHVYGKLGISSRRELPAALAGSPSPGARRSTAGSGAARSEPRARSNR